MWPYTYLEFDILTTDSGDSSWVTWSTPLPSLKVLSLFVLESCLMSSPIRSSNNAFAATAHVPDYVTCSKGAKNNYMCRIPYPCLSIHNATYIRLEWQLKAIYTQAFYHCVVFDTTWPCGLDLWPSNLGQCSHIVSQSLHHVWRS